MYFVHRPKGNFCYILRWFLHETKVYVVELPTYGVMLMLKRFRLWIFRLGVHNLYWNKGHVGSKHPVCRAWIASLCPGQPWPDLSCRWRKASEAHHAHRENTFNWGAGEEGGWGGRLCNPRHLKDKASPSWSLCNKGAERRLFESASLAICSPGFQFFFFLMWIKWIVLGKQYWVL